MNEPIIGIDLGTTNSEVAFVFGGRPEVLQEEGRTILPSCVGIDENGTVVVGERARNQALAAPERTVLSIKRKMGTDERVSMGDREYSPQEISAFILRTLRERASKALDAPVRKAVITVPAYFTDAQRQATREAGEIAGLEVVRIINEPTAAALSYESRRGDARTILVYDLGGGTFDVSIVRMEGGVVEVLASSGDNHLGGDDIDEILLRKINGHVEQELGTAAPLEDRRLRSRLLRAAERAKIELSEKPFVTVEEDHIATVDEKARHLSLEISRREFEDEIDELLGRTLRAVNTALVDADIRPSQLDRVLLVGGSTRIPLVTKRLTERLGQEPHSEVDPDLCVALGASVQAGVEMGQDTEAVLVDITPYTFGIAAIGELYGRPYEYAFSPIIRRNSKLPVSRTEVYFTVTDFQKAVNLDVYQGEDPDALRNVKIGSFEFDGLNSVPDARSRGLLTTFNLDQDGILQIRAVERATGKEIQGVIENVMVRSSPEEIRASRERIEELSGGGPLPDEPEPYDQLPGTDAEDTLRRAEAALATAPEEDRADIEELTSKIRTALAENLREDAEKYLQDLDELLFYLE